MLTVMLAFTLFAGWGCYNDAVIYPAGDFKGEVSHSHFQCGLQHFRVP